MLTSASKRKLQSEELYIVSASVRYSIEESSSSETRQTLIYGATLRVYILASQ